MKKSKLKKLEKSGKGFIHEFKEFIARGNVMDLAVGVIIGGAFQSIVKSLVDDIIMPLIGLVTGGIDFNNWFIVLGEGEYATLEAAKAAGVATFNYGVFLTNVLNFLIMAFVIFMIIKVINRLSGIGKNKSGETEEPAPTVKKCPFCMSEIDINASRCPHCTSRLEQNAQ